MQVIQNIEKNDIEELYQLGKICFPENTFNRDALFQMLENERYYFWGIWKNEKLVGYAIILDSIDIFEIVKIGVETEFRKQGIGEILLKDIISKSPKSIHLEVRESNLPAIKLYKKMGFENIFKRKKYYGDTGEDAIVMALNK